MVKNWSQFNESKYGVYYTEVLRNILRVNFNDMDLTKTYLNDLRSDKRINDLFLTKDLDPKLYNFFCELWSKIPTSINSNRWIIIPKIKSLGLDYKLPFNKKLYQINDIVLLDFVSDNYTKIFDADTCYNLMNQMYITNIGSHISELSVIRFLNENNYRTELPTLKEDIEGIDIFFYHGSNKIPIQVKHSDSIIEQGNDLIVSGALDLFKIKNIRYMFVNNDYIYSIKDGFIATRMSDNKWKISPKTKYTKIPWKTDFPVFNRNNDEIKNALITEF